MQMHNDRINLFRQRQALTVGTAMVRMLLIRQVRREYLSAMCPNKMAPSGLVAKPMAKRAQKKISQRLAPIAALGKKLVVIGPLRPEKMEKS